MKKLHPAFLTPLILCISVGASANVFAGVMLPPNRPVKMKPAQYSVTGIGKLPLRAQKVEINRAGSDMVTLRILSQNGAWTNHTVPAVSVPVG